MIHGLIFKAIRAQYEKTQNPLGHDVVHDDDEYLIHRYFRNVRGTGASARGLRLTDEGVEMMKSFFAHWIISLPADYTPKTQHIIFMDRIATMPWHLHGPTLTLFEPDLAMRLKLVGDIDSLINAFEVQGAV